MNTMTRARAPIRRILTRFPIEALMCAATFRADSAASKLPATSPKLLATSPQLCGNCSQLHLILLRPR
jgi:hypothetical protein